MTNENITPDQSSNLTAELDAAFAAKSSQQQQETGNTQQGNGEVESPSTSSESLGTTPSSSDTLPLSKESILSTLTMEDIKNHPELGKLFQSEADKVAAVKLQGSEARLRNQINLEVAAQHFASLQPEQLAEELLNSEAAKMYSHVVAAQAAIPDPKWQAQVDYYTRELRSTEARMRNAGLDEKTLASLDSNIHLIRPGEDPDKVMDAWKSKVEDAIIESKVAKRTGAITKTDSQAKELDSQAGNLSSSVDPLLTNGSIAPPRKDFMSTRSDVLLADAFAEVARRK